jgi:hypothetical protein
LSKATFGVFSHINAVSSSISIRFAWLLRMGPFRELQGLYIILFSILKPGWAGKEITRFF